jgi:hypothetical protein
MQPVQFDAALHPFIDDEDREQVVVGDGFDYVNAGTEVGAG